MSRARGRGRGRGRGGGRGQDVRKAAEKRKQDFDDKGSGKSEEKCSGTDAEPVVKVRKVVMTGVTIVSLTFTTDHGTLRNYNADWNGGGAVYAKPDWTAGTTNPITHTGGIAVGSTLRINVQPADVANAALTIRGASANPRLTFTYNGIVNGGEQDIQLVSVQNLAAAVRQVPLTLAWTFTWGEGNSGAQTQNELFVTLGAPAAVEGDGITRKRMIEAVRAVAATNSTAPHTIVNSIFTNFANYNLAIVWDNAWSFADALAAGADCQTIVRYIQGVIAMVGCPGTPTFVVVWALPATPAMPEVTRNARRPNIGDPANWRSPNAVDNTDQYWNQDATLLDLDGGQNRYEACLEFAHGGATYFYAGGVGRKDSAQDVLEAFFAMCWRSNDAADLPITDIVQRYRRAAADAGVIARLPARLRNAATA